MSIWLVLQIVLNVGLLIGLLYCLTRLNKNHEDDPRLNHGLRLLQSKIAVLEDLSDHTESQVKQLMNLLDKKLKDVRMALSSINAHISEVDRSIAKSKEVAQKITEQIPHQEIVDRKLNNKYVQAAQMAHQGHSVEQIVSELGLPINEVRLIAKVNKKKFVFENQLPEWTKNKKGISQDSLFAQSLELPNVQTESMKKQSENFRKAVEDHDPADQFQSFKIG